ncbi:hypothetical protein HED60_05485 [Planctomycetales bacterium ZRK34]|nr:hypothetical protein HED60_05485 [Planctomycetales bacterium ZRK34]
MNATPQDHPDTENDHDYDDDCRDFERPPVEYDEDDDTIFDADIEDGIDSE